MKILPLLSRVYFCEKGNEEGMDEEEIEFARIIETK
jgi:hypothetical protein